MSALDDLLSDPAALNRWGTEVQAGGQFFGGVSHVMFGIQSQQASAFQAAQLRRNASDAIAAGQHQAEDVQKQSDYIASQALATAAASGGGASDPGVVTLLAHNAAEGAYRRQVALYEGQSRGQALDLSAAAKEYEGANVRLNSAMVGASQAIGGASTILRGAAKQRDLLSRFGGDGPRINGASDEGWEG
ncbi:MAG TPA: hypothetical protein VIO33_02590 [Burkholderiaceae bacterium]